MRGRPGRLAGSVTAFLMLCTMGARLADAQQTAAEKVLKDNGLKRPSGATWSLTTEAAALRNDSKAKNLAGQLRNAQQQQRELDLGDQNPQVLIDHCRQQIDWLGDQIQAYDVELDKLRGAAGIGAANVQHNLLQGRARRAGGDTGQEERDQEETLKSVESAHRSHM